MFNVVVTCSFDTKTREQARYIRKFFDDAQSLMTCESSSFSSTDIIEKPSPIVLSWVVVLESRQDAIDVAEAVNEEIKKNGAASVADVLTLVGSSSSFTDNKWGWKETVDPLMTGTEGDRYLLQFPQPGPL